VCGQQHMLGRVCPHGVVCLVCVFCLLKFEKEGKTKRDDRKRVKKKERAREEEGLSLSFERGAGGKAFMLFPKPKTSDQFIQSCVSSLQPVSVMERKKKKKKTFDEAKRPPKRNMKNHLLTCSLLLPFYFSWLFIIVHLTCKR